MFESRISKELQRRIFELTLALYRVTDFFPQAEVLRKQLREKANEIFGGFTEYGFSDESERDAVGILSKIEALKGYLGIARSQRFIKPINITVLEREYEILASFLMRELDSIKNQRKEEKVEDKPVQKETKIAQADEDLPTWQEFSEEVVATNKIESKETVSEWTSISEGINNRQKTILEHLKQSQQVKVSDFFQVFNGISSKTIQRDLQDLVAKNVLKKEGEKRWTTYLLNNVQ